MVLEQHTQRRRRLAAALVGALAFHALLGLLLLPRFFGSWGLQGGAGGGDARGPGDRFLEAALRGTDVAVRAPAPSSAVAAPEPVEEEPVEPEAQIPDPEAPPTPPVAPADPAPPAEVAPGAATAGAAGDPHEGTHPGEALQGDGDPGGGLVPSGPVEMDVQPRFWVYPELPQKVLRKHKIKNEDVVLRLLVGTNGLVRDVQVLRTIPNCEECTQSAVDAARRQRYDAYMLDGRLVEVWTTFKFTFSSGR